MGINIASGFNEGAGVPLDLRTVVADNTARDATSSVVRYIGLSIYVTTTQKMWQLQAGVTNGDWVDISAGGGGSSFPIPDNVQAVWGTTAPFGITALTTTVNPEAVITTPLHGLTVISSEANKTYDFFPMSIPFSAPVVVLTGEDQVRNEWLLMGSGTVPFGQPRQFKFIASSSDEVNDTPHSDDGCGFGISAGDGGSLGGNPGSLYFSAGSGKYGTIDGGSFELVPGMGFGGTVTSIDATPPNAGLNYVALDVVNLNGGTNNATVRIDTVDAFGAVTGMTLILPGDGYLVGTNSTFGGSGNGLLTITVLTIGGYGRTGVVKIKSLDPGKKSASLAFDNGAAPDLSFSGETLIYADSSNQLMVSSNGGAYAPIGGGGVTDLVASTLATASGAMPFTVVDSAGVDFQIPLSGTDTTNHDWSFGFGGYFEFLRVSAVGDGAGDVASALFQGGNLGKPTDFRFYSGGQTLPLNALGWAYVGGSGGPGDATQGCLVGSNFDATLGAGGVTGVAGVIDSIDVTPTAGGLGYTMGDVLTISTGNGDATLSVSGVGALGTVTNFTLVARGTGYSASAGQATSYGGAGFGATVEILSIRYYSGGKGGSFAFDAGAGGVGSSTFTSGNGGDVILNAGAPGADGGAGLGNPGVMQFNIGASNVITLNSGGTFVTGKLDVSGNILSSAYLFGSSGAATAASDLVLSGHNYNLVSGNSQINAITSPANVTAGTSITLAFSGTPTVKHNTSGGAGTTKMLLAGSSDFVAAADSVLCLQFNGSNWYETSRTVA